MITLRDVGFSYSSGKRAIDTTSLEIGSGLTLLLGPNGAGKSTLMKMLSGVERPDSGTILIDGFDVWKDEVAARKNLAYIPEYPDLTPYATIQDVISLVCRLRAEPFANGMAALDRAGLRSDANRSVRELSMGQRRRAVMAAAWVGRPNVVLLDEPLESMDRWIRGSILSWIHNLLAEKATVILATHQTEPFLAEADRIITVRNGVCRKHEPLPADPIDRRQFVEGL